MNRERIIGTAPSAENLQERLFGFSPVAHIQLDCHGKRVRAGQSDWSGRASTTQLEETAVACRPLRSILLLLGLMTFALTACADKEPGPAAPTAAPGTFQDPADSGAIGTENQPIEGADQDQKP